MKKLKLFISVILIMSVWLGLSGFRADENKIIDDANLLTSSEEKRVQEKLLSAAEKLELDLVFYSFNDKGVSDNRMHDYADDFWKENGFGYNREYGNGVMMMINMGTRAVYIYERKTDDSQYRLTDTETYAIVDGVTEYLADGEYENAVCEFISLLDQYSDFDEAPDDAYDGEEDSYNINGKKKFFKWSYLFIALVLTAIIMFILCRKQKSHTVTDGITYTDKDKFRVAERSDIFTHTTVTKHHIERDNDSDSGHFGGSSSGGGGSSHGGGGHF